MLYLDAFPKVLLKLRVIFVDRVLKRDFAFLRQLQYGSCRKLFGNRGNVKKRVAVDRLFRVDVGNAVSFVKDDIVTLHDKHGGSGFLLRKQPGTEVINGLDVCP